MMETKQRINRQSPKRLFVSLREVASDLGVSYVTAHSYVKNGFVPSVKVGNTRRVLRQKYEVWYEQLFGAKPPSCE